MIDWTTQIEVGTDIKEVKQEQPEFLKIAWDSPDTLNNQLRYEIIEIKNNNDMLSMRNFLVFEHDKFVGRSYIK